jgi:hypothetical protein
MEVDGKYNSHLLPIKYAIIKSNLTRKGYSLSLNQKIPGIRGLENFQRL